MPFNENKPQRTPDPTPEEIAAECTIIRAKHEAEERNAGATTRLITGERETKYMNVHIPEIEP